MEIKTTTEFVTTDGQKFTVKEDAEAHEKFYTAKKDFDKAKEVFKRVIAEQFVTADGEPFTLVGRTFDDYYLVDNYALEIERISFWVWHVDFDVDEYERGVIRLYEKKDGNSYSERLARNIHPSKLYAHKNNANKRLLELKKERIATDMEWIEKLEKSIR